MPMAWPPPVTLRRPEGALVPLSHDHHDDLVEAVRDGELWRLWYTFIPPPQDMHAEIDRRLGLAGMQPFAVIEPSSGRAVGMTTYLNCDAVNRRVEVGATWYRRSVQRTALNTACKLMMLGHAFDTLGCIAVELRTHVANAQSRGAIERLGAKLDGILRSHMVMPNGTLRDTCVYSVISEEWPAVRERLQTLLR